MQYINGISINTIRADLIDYAMSMLPSTSGKRSIVASMCQMWQDQVPSRYNLTPDQYRALRRIGYQAYGIALGKKCLRVSDKKKAGAQLNLFKGGE